MTAPTKPNPKYKFTFGLWTVGNPGRDPFGVPTREVISPVQIADMLGEVGAYGVNFHDNDLIPIDATAAQADADQEGFQESPEGQRPGRADGDHQSVQRPGLQGRRVHQQQRRRSAPMRSRRPCGRWTWAPSSARRFMSSGAAARASRATPPRIPVEAIKRFREAINFLCEYSISQKYGYKFAFEAKPNEPRGHIYFAVTGSYLALHSDAGSSRDVRRESRSRPRAHGRAEFRSPGRRRPRGRSKLFHIDLNDQEFGRYDQDFRFGQST